MSGGSWNYLFCKAPDDILGDLSTMIAMRDRLIELGAEGTVVEDMSSIVIHLREAHRLGATLRMNEVWHEVEWKDSGDHGIERLRQAVWQYNGSPPCDHETRTEPLVSYMWLDDEQRGTRVRYQHCTRCGARIILEKDVKP